MSNTTRSRLGEQGTGTSMVCLSMACQHNTWLWKTILSVITRLQHIVVNIIVIILLFIKSTSILNVADQFLLIHVVHGRFFESFGIVLRLEVLFYFKTSCTCVFYDCFNGLWVQTVSLIMANISSCTEKIFNTNPTYWN